MEARSRDISRQRRVGTWQARLHTAAPRGLRGLCCPRKGPNPTPGNGCSSPYPAAPRATHVSHWDEGIGQLLNATFPVEPGQEREAKGHVEQHGNTHVGLPGRRVPTGVGGQRVSTDGLGAEKRVGERRQTQGRTAPHPLGGVLGLLGAEDERELLQPVPKLLARGELAADEGQWPHLEDPVKEQRGWAFSASRGLSCLPGSEGPSV